jgi:hypothetical protein
MKGIENETWKDVIGYEGLYQASNLGRIRSFARINKWIVIKPVKTKFGYCKIQLHKKGEVKTFLTHRLVACAFINNPLNKPCIDHINGIKTDNSVNNLRWCDHSQNINNPLTIKKLSSSKIGTKCYLFGKFGKEHPISKRIIMCDNKNDISKEYDSITMAANELGIMRQSISKVCRGVNKTANKLIFKYV